MAGILVLQLWICWTRCWPSTLTKGLKWRRLWHIPTWNNIMTLQMRSDDDDDGCLLGWFYVELETTVHRISYWSYFQRCWNFHFISATAAWHDCPSKRADAQQLLLHPRVLSRSPPYSLLLKPRSSLTWSWMTYPKRHWRSSSLKKLHVSSLASGPNVLHR